MSDWKPEQPCVVGGTEIVPGDDADQCRQKLARIALDAMRPLAGVLDSAGTVLDFGRAALEAAGLAPSDVIGKPFWETMWWTVAPQTQAQLREAVLQAARGERVRYNVDLYARQGSRELVTLDFTLLPVRDQHGRVVFLLPEGRDVTATSERQRDVELQHVDRSAELTETNERLELELEQQRTAHFLQARLAAIIESSDDAIVSKSLDGTITSWNHAAEKMFGYSAAEAVGRNILLIVPPDRQDEERSILSRLREGRKIDHFETQRVRKDGRRIEVSLSVSPICDAAGRTVGASKIARDITEKKRSERERDSLLDAERHARETAQRVNSLKDEFLATLSHELRTPLSAIMGWAQLLAMGNMDAEGYAEAGRVIERNARTQKQLIDDLLDMSRIISGKLRLDLQRIYPADFIEGAVETIGPSAEAKGIRLEKMLDALAGPIAGDPARLQQVVWNLLSNAVKFTPKGGKIQILLERVNSHLEITVADSGEGIDPEFLPHLFERFRQADATTTRRHGGLGLGLSIVKQITELHGGTVRAMSAGRGTGSTFVISLPMLIVHTPAEEDERVHPRSSFGAIELAMIDLSNLKVLVVDDEPDARELVRRLLSECGAVVQAADSAAAALALLSAETPDVLVSDIGMPETDGYELLRQVRKSEKSSRIPAVALTAFARTEDRTRALRAGYIAHVAKPVEPAELLATIAVVTGRPTAG